MCNSLVYVTYKKGQELIKKYFFMVAGHVILFLLP